MKRVLSVAIAAALMVVGGGAFVLAQTTTSLPACADIVGGQGVYLPASRETSAAEVEKALTNLGQLDFVMYVGGDSATPAVSCPNVTYSVVVLDDAETSAEVTNGQSFVISPAVLATASVPGDGLTNALRFSIPVNDDDDTVCVYLTTSGTPQGGTSSKNGAAFDGGPATALLDRAPDGGSGVGAYCVEESEEGPATSYR